MTVDRWAWDEYWREPLPSGGACMAGAPLSFHKAINQHWLGIAGRFDERSTIVDLGCGNGAAGHRVAVARPDLEVIGVDFADVGGRADRAYIPIHSRVAIEQLPFDSCSLGGAISQFGFEYCHVEQGVTEVARVLRRGAPFCLIVHHGHSPIVVDNVRSERALRQLLSPPMRDAFCSGNKPIVHAMVAALPDAARADPTIQLLSSALFERLAWPPRHRAALWDTIAEAMRPEVALAAALNRSAVKPGHLQRWLEPFDALFDQVDARPLQIDGQTMAWKVEARRAG